MSDDAKIIANVFVVLLCGMFLGAVVATIFWKPCEIVDARFRQTASCRALRSPVASPLSENSTHE